MGQQRHQRLGVEPATALVHVRQRHHGYRYGAQHAGWHDGSAAHHGGRRGRIQRRGHLVGDQRRDDLSLHASERLGHRNVAGDRYAHVGYERHGSVRLWVLHSGGEGYAVIVHRDTTGAWTRQYLGPGYLLGGPQHPSVLAVAGVGTPATSLYAAVVVGGPLHAGSDGIWSVISGYPSGAENCYGVWAASTSAVWFACGSGVYQYDGTTWSAPFAPSGVSCSGIWGSSGNDIYVVGSDGNGMCIYHWFSGLADSCYIRRREGGTQGRGHWGRVWRDGCGDPAAGARVRGDARRQAGCAGRARLCLSRSGVRLRRRADGRDGAVPARGAVRARRQARWTST